MLAGVSEQAELARILRETRSIAVLGASADPARASNDIYRYLKARSDEKIGRGRPERFKSAS